MNSEECIQCGCFTHWGSGSHANRVYVVDFMNDIDFNGWLCAKCADENTDVEDY